MNPVLGQMLSNYAQVIVRVGLNLRKGQRLHIIAPLDSSLMVREVVKAAYQAGAKYVDANLLDEQHERLRVQYADADTMDQDTSWRVKTAEAFIDNGDALLSVTGSDPNLFAGLDQEKVKVKQRAEAIQRRSMLEKVTADAINWLVAAAATPVWASKVFPDLPIDQAVSRLWELIFRTCRLDRPDPVAAWQSHLADLKKRSDYLNGKAFTALHYRAPGTDLTIGLPTGHIWHSGASTAKNGVSFVANLPTEEVFTLPHKDRIDGVVTASKPLSYRGSLIDGFSLKFSEGMVVNATAKVGQGALDSILNTDPTSRSLGEVALVPHSSPISQSGVLFLNTLFDENASNHLALGAAYRNTLKDSENMTDEEFAAAGGNESMTHCDFMIGSDAMDVDGIAADGSREPVMRSGEWAFKV